MNLQSHDTTFVKPTRVSRAIPIVNPDSRKESPTRSPKVDSSDSRLVLSPKVRAQKEAALAAAVARGQIEKALNQPSPAVSRISKEDEFERGFDVYATPFVPEKIKVVNTLPGRHVASTLPSKGIDLDAYAREALGSRLLPPVVAPNVAHPLHASLLDPPALMSLTYESFFRFHIDLEIQHQQRENESYSLHAHEAVVEFLGDEQARVTAQVPGLRENSPYVEEDDVVQLRQLRFDHAGRLLEGLGHVVPFGAAVPLYPAPGPWTEIIYNSRVIAVRRSTEKEELILLVSGMTYHSSEVLVGYPPGHLPAAAHKIRFNIQFPVPADRYWPMVQALPQVQSSLLRANKITAEAQAMTTSTRSAATMVNAFWIQSMLFPTEVDCAVQANAHSGSFSHDLYDRALNHEQRIAVENLCGQNYGVMPYLISGPPGTGKTKTMIEIALQLINNVACVSHILICAPSEQAADTLADRLRAYVKPSEMLRLNRPTRTFNEVPDTILQYCHSDGTAFDMPPFEKLMAYKMVVTSCRDAHMLMRSRMTNTDLYTVESGLRARIHPQDPPPATAQLHWNALLIDEAAQATEPESLIPLLVVASPPDAPQLVFTPLLVMAGDENQLTPRTSSPRTPLQRSLFARLFARPVYANHPLARHFRSHPGAPATAPLTISPDMVPVLRPAFTNLIRNYRSHPAILAVPSALFYADTLVPEADPSSTHRLQAWKGWPRSGFHHWPVLFHNNTSPDDLERDGGGWYNDGEAQLACHYALSLAKSGLVAEAEICIMSPFKAQVRRIRKLIRQEPFRLWGVNVGPTEAFQGLEYGVVILCVTRSRRRFVQKDRELGWGVVGMPNKMNVALTRAKFGLIMLGSRELLVKEDQSWRAVVAFCERNGLVVGDKDDVKRKTGDVRVAMQRTKIESYLVER